MKGKLLSFTYDELYCYSPDNIRVKKAMADSEKCAYKAE